jgi:hypothetical protein
MGEVYRARDTRLGRDVAIKVLPGHSSSNAELRQRLEREARAISALSHPNICALFDVGHQDGIDFLVMEYLEGETLAERLGRGALPPDDVLRCGIEIANALDSAHRKGIVHRDLKPGNVMLTRGGAKVLDFGLAKAAGGGATPFDSNTGPTRSAPLTAEGSLMGTPHYMAPEQVEGREADARSDIFALGAVLHEMATGQRAFGGTSAAGVIAAVLEKHPPAVSSLQPSTAAAFDDVVHGCLAKDPDERWQAARDVGLQLQALRRRPAQAAAGPASGRRLRREWIAWTLAAAALVAAVGLALRSAADPPPPARLVRAALLPPAAHSFVPHEFAVSPDGRRVAFVAAGADGVSTLWVSALEASQPLEVSGSGGARYPFWSPDSRWIAFFAGDELRKVEPGGAGVQAICAVQANARRGAWGVGGAILFESGAFGPLSRVQEGGGAAVVATPIPANMPGEAHRFPSFLADGTRFLYVINWTNQQRGGVYLGRLDGGEPTLVSPDIRGRILLAQDQLLFVRDGTLYAQPFDSALGRLAGTPRAIVRNEMVADPEFGGAPMSASQNGILVFQSRLSYGSRLVWYDRSGRELGTVGEPGFSSPALSPDGRRVAVTFDRSGSGQPQLFVHDLQRNVATQVTSDGIVTAHAWSGDGRWLAYSSRRSGEGIYRRPWDGSGKEDTLVESSAHLLVNNYSRDGRRLLYMDFAGGLPVLQSYDVESRTSETLSQGAEGAFSPDGRWITSVGYPAFSLLVAPATGDGGRVQLSSGAGAQARWRADGTEIFYIGPDKKMMSVPVRVRDGVLEPGNPVPLFQTRIVQTRLVLFQYDVSADGQRFLVNSLPREDAAASLTLLVNWTEELRR